MALKIWLPLNEGTFNNKGICLNSDITSGTYSFDNNGKIGKCLKASTSVETNIPLSEWDFTTQSISMGCWVKMDLTEMATAINAVTYDGTYQYGGGSVIGRCSYGGFALRWQTNKMYGSSFSTITIYSSLRSSSGQMYTTSEFVIPSNTWTHIFTVFDRKEAKLLLYINGALFATTNLDMTKLTPELFVNGLGSFNIHQNSTDGGNKRNPAAPFYINDIRVYDEALSPKQIKEISKGLVCHYKLATPGINNNLAVDNPLINSGATSISYDNVTRTYTIVSPVGESTWGYGVNIGSTNKCIVPWNSTYRFSFEVYIPTQHDICIDYNNYANEGSSWGGNDNDLGGARLPNVVTIPANTWTKCVFGSKNANTNNTNQVAIYDVSKIGLRTMNDTEPTTWYLRNFKYELGDTATEYVPHDYQWDWNLYTDASGNGYNVTKTGTLTFNNDSPRYSGSTYFNGSSYLTSSSGSMAWFPFDNLTISAWLKPTVKPSDWTGSIGIQQDGNPDGKVFSISNYAGNFSVHTDNGSSWVTTQSNALPLNEWSYCVATLTNGNDLKMYINGTLVKTATLNYNTAVVKSDTRIAIGVDLPGGDEKYTGCYSDIKIYATALSADDILTMYKNSGIIDNKGNVYAYEFKEE